MGCNMRAILRRFRADRRGATSIEYALIGVLISIAVIGGASSLGNSLTSYFSNSAGKLDNAGQ